MSDARIWFVVEAGVLTRGGAKRAIESYCWQHGLAVQFQESKGLLRSVYRVVIEGPDAPMRNAFVDLQGWFREQERGY